jgi:hypothetical protein
MAELPSKLLIHIGYHKTASTWLQRVVFDSGRFGLVAWGPDGSEQSPRPISNANTLCYDVDEIRRFYLDRLRPDIPEGAWVALSSERFSGSLFGAYDSASNGLILRETFPGAHIMVVVREQKAIILSTYSQYVKKGGLLPLSKFLSEHTNTRVPFFLLRQFEYHHLVSYYMHLFDRDKVLVLPYELIGSSAGEFIQAIRRFVGIEGEIEEPPSLRFNVARDALALALMRRVNYLRRSDAVNGFSPFASRRVEKLTNRLCRKLKRLNSPVVGARNAAIRLDWQKQIEQAVGRRYAESNRRLAELTGLDLSRFGYDLP